MHCHQFRYPCLGNSLESDSLVGESFSHLLEDGPGRQSGVVDPEDLAMSALYLSVRGDDLIDDESKPLLVHGGDVIEPGAVLIDVGTDAWVLG